MPTPRPAKSAEPIATTALPNATFVANPNPGEFTSGLDPDTKRADEPAMLLSSTTKRWGDGGFVFRGVEERPFLGKRIRFSAWVKCKDLANWGGLILSAAGSNETVLAGDDMGDRPLTKSADWQKLEIVADIPPETMIIRIGLILRGAGELWMDGATVEVVGKDVPTTDDQNWHCWSYSRPHYSTMLDPATQRNGHATRLLTSTVAGPGEWFAWDHNDRHPDQYRGHTVKMTAWIKTENVTANSGFTFRVLKGSYQDIVPDAGRPVRTIRGTHDWKKYEVTAEVPENTEDLCTGFRFGGKGKLWFDDVQYEIVK